MDKFRNGNIVSLKLENFQTFQSQSFHFGPYLNLIAAPNGTGKSSIANAIALLFGGNAKTIGKTKEISEYIRFSCQQATIEAEVFIEGKIVLFKRLLFNNITNISEIPIKINKNNMNIINLNPNNSTLINSTINNKFISNTKINREFIKSQYFINNNLIIISEYMRYLKKYKIVTDNLSVFLPQEKVGAFCNMNPKELMNELLRNSDISLNKYYELQNEYKKIEKACETKLSTKQLMENHLKNMEDALKEFKMARELEERKFFLNCKQTYMKYDELCEEYKQIKNGRKVQKERITELQVQIEDDKYKKENLEKVEIVCDYKILCEKLRTENVEIQKISNELHENIQTCEYLHIDKKSIERKEKEWIEKKMILEKELETNNECIYKSKLEIINEMEISIKKIIKFYKKMVNLTNEKKGSDWEIFNRKVRVAQDFSIELSKFKDIDLFKGNKIKSEDCIIKSTNSDIINISNNNYNNISKTNINNINYCLDNDKIIEFKNKFNNIIPTLDEYNTNIRDTEDAIQQIKTASLDLQIKIDGLESEKLRHNEQKERRLFQLNSYHSDTFKAVSWLRENTSKFKEEVLEPAFLHIEIDEEFRSEIENLLNFQSLSSFLVRNEEDFSKLSRILKDDLKLWVNIAEVVDKQTDQSINKKSNSVQFIDKNIKNKYNIAGMACEFIKARSEYIDFINRYSHLNNIPISKNEIQENELFDKLPMLKRLVANGIYIEIIRSRYDKSWVINRSCLKELNLFKIPKINITEVEKCLEKAKIQREKHCQAMEIFLSKKVEHDKKVSEFKKEISFSNVKKSLCLYEELIKGISRIKDMLRQQDLGRDKAYQIEKEKNNNEQYDMLTKKLNIMLNPDKLPLINVIEAEELIEQIGNYENNISFAKHTIEAHEQAIREYNNNLDELKKKIKILKNVIKLSCESEYLIEKNNKLENDGIKNYNNKCLEKENKDILNSENKLSLLKSKLEELPDLVSEILNEISFIDSKLEVMQNRGGVKLEYEKKEKELLLISQNITQFDEQKQIIEMELKCEEKEIKKLLENLISPISAKFSEFFRHFGCRGELQWKLENGDWILQILVSFRNCELLTQLSAERQSGGEKSLATVLFLLALQQSTNVGFRLVDEINQGMDATNERIVFKLLSEISLERQFFIITPKLVDNLVFSENTHAIILYGANGMTKALEKYTKALIN